MRRALPALAALAVAIGGCGDDNEGSRGTLTVEAGRPVPVRGFEYGFEPGTITVRAGGRESEVRFELTNAGSLPHDLHVREGDEELGGTEAIGDGDEASATVKLAPGDYEFYCSIGDHADLGMKGDLKVE
jgi:plastocyanin